MSGKKLKIAITGGMGSGKSEFAKFIIKGGYKVINADKTAKDILINNPNVKNKIIKKFGQNSYVDSGLNTKYLAETVFANPENVKTINAIVHPEVIKQIDSVMNEFLQDSDFVFVEAALIFEAEMESMFDYIVLVTTDEKIKIDRILQREKTTEEEIRQRMENQIPDETKKMWSDFIFENNKSLDDLKSKADFFITILNSLTEKN